MPKKVMEMSSAHPKKVTKEAKKEKVKDLVVKRERAKRQMKKPLTREKEMKANLQKKIMKKAKRRPLKKKNL